MMTQDSGLSTQHFACARYDHNSFRLIAEGVLTEIAPEVFDVKASVTEMIELVDGPGTHHGPRLGDFRPFLVPVRRVPDTSRVSRLPRFFDRQRATNRTFPISRTIHPLENNAAIRCQMIGDAPNDAHALLCRCKVSHRIVGKHDQIEWRKEGEGSQIGDDEVRSGS